MEASLELECEGYFWTLWHPVQLSEEPGNKGVTQSVSLFLEKAENLVWNHSESPLPDYAECTLGEENAGQKCCVYQLGVTQSLLHASSRFIDLKRGSEPT